METNMQSDSFNIMNELPPQTRERLSRFLEIERWHRQLLSAYATPPDGSITRRCWEAAYREVPLSATETRIYKQLQARSPNLRA